MVSSVSVCPGFPVSVLGCEARRLECRRRCRLQKDGSLLHQATVAVVTERSEKRARAFTERHACTTG